MRRGNHELAPVEIVAEEAKQAHVALVESLKEGSISHALGEELSIAERLYVQQRQPLGAPDECDAINLRVTRTLLENALQPGGMQCGQVVEIPILNFLQPHNVGIEAQDAINDLRLPVRERAGIALPVEVRIICSVRVAEDVPRDEPKRGRGQALHGSRRFRSECR